VDNARQSFYRVLYFLYKAGSVSAALATPTTTPNQPTKHTAIEAVRMIAALQQIIIFAFLFIFFRVQKFLFL
jgi:hypothetical protein